VRVISGTARGTKLRTIEGLGTRPTTDRVKEAIFNLVQFHIRGSRILDLFAGSGSLGIEAASRGAEFVCAVESNNECIKILNENYTKTRLSDNAEIIKTDVIGLLQSKRLKDGFDVIFMDPPYNKGFEVKALKAIRENALLNDQGIIVVEHSVDTEMTDTIEGYEIYKQKKYGITMVSVLREAE